MGSTDAVRKPWNSACTFACDTWCTYMAVVAIIMCLSSRTEDTIMFRIL